MLNDGDEITTPICFYRGWFGDRKHLLYMDTPFRDTYFTSLEPVTNDDVSNNDMGFLELKVSSGEFLEFVQKNLVVQNIGEEDKKLYLSI